MEPDEACDKLRTTLKVLGSFKSHYFAYKAASAAECPDSPWRFQNSLIFGRLDMFLERCADIMELQSTCLQVRQQQLGDIAANVTQHCNAACCWCCLWETLSLFCMSAAS